MNEGRGTSPDFLRLFRLPENASGNGKRGQLACRTHGCRMGFYEGVRETELGNLMNE